MPLQWYSRSQCSTVTASTASELYALSFLVREHSEPIATALEAALGRCVKCTTYEDNTATELVAKAGYSAALRYLARTTRLAVGLLGEYWCEERPLVREASNKMRADCLTKRLSGHHLLHGRKLVRVAPVTESCKSFDLEDA